MSPNSHMKMVILTVPMIIIVGAAFVRTNNFFKINKIVATNIFQKINYFFFGSLKINY